MELDYLSKEQKRSMYKKAAGLAECFEKKLPGLPLPDAHKKVMDDFFAFKDISLEKMIMCYYELAVDSALPVYEDNEEELAFVENMTNILGYSTYLQYDPTYEDYHTTFQEFCRKAFLEGKFYPEYIIPNCLSDIKMDYLQRLAHIWTGSENSLQHVDTFAKFDEKMKKSREPFDSEIYYNYILRFIEDIFANDDEISTSKYTDIDRQKNINYWISYVAKKLENGDIQSVWDDEVLNIYFQMVNVGDKIFDESTHLTESRNTFLSKENLSPDSDRVKSAIETMESILKKEYKDKELDDESKLKQYIDAFKIVYLQEYLSGTMQDPQATSSKYAKFIIMQFDALKRFGEIDYIKNQKVESEEDKKDSMFIEAFQRAFAKSSYEGSLPSPNSSEAEYRNFVNKIVEELKNPIESKSRGLRKPKDYERVLYRAYASFVIKEAAEKIRDKWEDERDTAVLVTRNSAISQYTAIVGSAKEYGKVNTITYSPIHPEDFGDTQRFIEVAGHEVTHIVNGGVDVHFKHMDFDPYMEAKTRIFMEGEYKYALNYYSAYQESRAGIGGDIAIIEALKEFPIGDKAKVQETINNKKKWVIDSYRYCLDNSLYSIKGDHKNLVIISDEYFSNGLDVVESNRKYCGFKDMLLFEYNEDGTPKSFSQIIKDQEKEMETGVIPPVGPQDMLGRIKFRMRMMMQRAVAYQKEEEFIQAFEKFLEDNQEELYKENFFQEVFPDRKIPTSDQAEEKASSLFDEERYADAEFITDIKEIEERIQRRKRQFGDTVIPGLEKQVIEQETTKTEPQNSNIDVDQIPE